jgi:thiol-disulfide isomerase/thioredoxin
MALLRRRASRLLLAATVILPGRVLSAEVRVGDPAPPLALQTLDGRRVDLGDLRGRVVCVDVWATWCAPCRTALPALDAVARRTPGAVFLAVGLDASRDTVRRWVAERLPGTTMTVLHDPDGSVPARWGAGGMPALWVVDRDGVVRLAKSGWAPGDLAEVERLLATLVGGPAP